MIKPEKIEHKDVLTKDKALELIFSDLFRAYEYPLYTLALRLSKDDFVAKDIIQEVFMSLWNMREKLHEINNIEGYLFRITRFKVIGHLRKVSADDRLKEKIWLALKDLEQDGAARIEEKEFNAVLATAIAQLPLKRKQVYLLKTSEGKTYKDIADEMKISQHTVKNHLSSATASIRDFLSLIFR
ncbi:RNA polymerase sigma-70 factor (family 1) [Pedobacter africanus]|uniref:RNA polymerase sigma-70 factor (ECF subfamily) n=1 Tax=Pedobacter africanus TaxID=151894 RepID=A0ACC6KVI4_9SPHI|nr:RNA polymerase sigma-70 factor [Pedobacter africanus]MDR6783252.1 RNA polymerase sigma-70 factor (ECF subfamily) [Pedobacter africanus]